MIMQIKFVGQGHRSKVNVSRSKMFVMGFSMNSQWDVCEKRDGLMDGTVRPTPQGVLKAYAASFILLSDPLSRALLTLLRSQKILVFWGLSRPRTLTYLPTVIT